MKQLAPWQENITYMAVIYSMLEQGKKLSTLLEGDDAFLDPVLDGMFRRELVSINKKNEYVVTKKGEELRKSMVGMYDQLLRYEIFGSVNQTLSLTKDQGPLEEDGTVLYAFDDKLDPRFTDVPGTSEDLRLAMLDWLSTTMKDQLAGKQVDLHQVVFVQQLRKGKYAGSNLWFALQDGEIFKDIEDKVSSAVKWQKMSAHSVEDAASVMQTIYTLGMIEQRKRDGERCRCGAYLGMHQHYADQAGKTLDMCPCCEGSFKDPTVEGASQACPNCGTDIFPRQRKCKGCGAKIDRSLPAGSVNGVTTVSTDPVWTTTYVDMGYVAPFVVFDPWYPYADVVAFGYVCEYYW